MTGRRVRRAIIAGVWLVAALAVWQLCRAAAADAEDCGYSSCPPPPSTGSTTTAPSTTTTTTAPTRIHGGLPITGGDIGGVVVIALVVIVAGSVVLYVRWRREGLTGGAVEDDAGGYMGGSW